MWVQHSGFVLRVGDRIVNNLGCYMAYRGYKFPRSEAPLGSSIKPGFHFIFHVLVRCEFSIIGGLMSKTLLSPLTLNPTPLRHDIAVSIVFFTPS